MTTTAMQFGQSTINVVLGEGTVPAKFGTDSSGNVTGLVGPGAQSFKADRVGSSILFIGDSRTARSNYHVASTATNSVVGDVLTLNVSTVHAPVGSRVLIRSGNDARLYGEWPILSYSTAQITARLDQDLTGADVGLPTVMLEALYGDTGIWAYAQGYSTLNNRPLTMAMNWGKPGAKASDWVAIGSDGLRLIERVLQRHPSDRVFIDLGTNDAQAGVTAEAFAADMEIIYAAILESGRIVDAATCVYLDSASSTANALIKAYNGYIREKCGCTANMVLVDQAATCKDAGGDYSAAGVLASDNVHYGPDGARLCGKTYANAIAASVPIAPIRRPTRSADGFDTDPAGWNKVKNPLFVGSGGTVNGGITGPVPDAWDISRTGGTVVVTQPARASGIGSDLQVAWTTTNSTSMLVEQDMTTLLPPGTVIARAGMEIEVVAAGAGHYIIPMLQITTAAGEVRCAALRNAQTYANGGKWPTAGERMWFGLPEGFQIPSDATDVDFTVLLQAGAAGTQTVKIGMPQLEIE